MAATAIPVGSGVSVPRAVLPTSLAGQAEGGPDASDEGPVAASPASPAVVAEESSLDVASRDPPLDAEPVEVALSSPAACSPPSGAVLAEGVPHIASARGIAAIPPARVARLAAG